MLRRLRVKFVCTNMLFVVIILSVVLTIALHTTKRSLESQSIQLLRTISNSMSLPGRPGDPLGQFQLPHIILQINNRGEVITASSSYYDLSDTAFLNDLAQTVLADTEQSGIVEQYQLRYYRTNALHGYKIVFADISSERSTLTMLTRACALIWIVCTAVFFLISILLARWAVLPVDHAWKQQRQFVADASHELKTPLTVILTNTELLQQTVCTEEERTKFLNNIRIMSLQMRGLVEGLLELARADNRDTTAALDPLNLSQLATNTVLPFEAVFFEKELPLDYQIDENICVRGSELHLRQVMDILLDNAQKYAAPQTPVRLQLTKNGRGSCLLLVSTHGDTISKEDLKNIFKRFYRIDKVRTLSHSYGLGLSIAQSIVTSHKGKIWAESHNGINTFYVQLPTV